MGLRFISNDININFIGARRIAFAVSVILILLGVGSLLFKGGPRYGIDFAGGIMVQISFKEKVQLEEIKNSLKDAAIPDMVVQRFGMEDDNEFLIRVSALNLQPGDVRQSVETAFAQHLGDKGWEIQRLEMVGPKVGEDLRNNAMEALFYAVLLIAIYISGRFEQRWWAAGLMAGALSFAMYVLGLLSVPMAYLTLAAMFVTLALCWRLKLNYALGAVIALIHDVMITVGVFSLLNKEFDLTIVAALLTIVGYSLNDTIIVFDRIRENLRLKISNRLSVTINTSINQTLSRTLLTSGTTLLVVFCLYMLGGGVIHDFALALLIGVGVGTYSSIFVASPILLAFQPREEPEAA
jgi:preprotein translocase subunit SecF